MMNTIARPQCIATSYSSSPPLLLDVLKAKLVRGCEIVIALSVLILSSPIMALLWIAIKIDSPGPALFKQTRVGKNYRNGHNGHPPRDIPALCSRRRQNIGGKPFTFYKFRTMYHDARERFPELYSYQYTPEEIQTMRFKLVDDPRVTRLGKFLRRTTLDELPNFINLLKGDIALVGPRPDIPEMIPYYKKRQLKKLAVRPGITGLSQVSGRGILTFQDSLKYDVYYVEHQSLWLDIKILLKTLLVSISRLGAF